MCKAEDRLYELEEKIEELESELSELREKKTTAEFDESILQRCADFLCASGRLHDTPQARLEWRLGKCEANYSV